MTMGLLLMDVMSVAALAGTCSSVRQLPKAAENAMRMSTMERVSTHCSSERQTPFQSRPR